MGTPKPNWMMSDRLPVALSWSATLVFRAVLWPESIVPKVPSGPPCGGRSRAAPRCTSSSASSSRERVLDDGCGFGFDADHFGWDGYDLFYRPENPVGPYDTILCNLVLNALSRNRRAEVLENILRLLAENGRAYLTVARNLPPTGTLGVHHSVRSYVVLTLPSIFVDESIEIYEMSKRAELVDKTKDFVSRRDRARAAETR